jgi:hypothetical protein
MDLLCLFQDEFLRQLSGERQEGVGFIAAFGFAEAIAALMDAAE